VVIMEDADMDLAVESTAQGAFGSSGQRCHRTSRAVVVNDVAVICRTDCKTCGIVRIGPGNDPATEMGPTVDESQFKTVFSYIESAVTTARPSSAAVPAQRVMVWIKVFSSTRRSSIA